MQRGREKVFYSSYRLQRRIYHIAVINENIYLMISIQILISTNHSLNSVAEAFRQSVSSGFDHLDEIGTQFTVCIRHFVSKNITGTAWQIDKVNSQSITVVFKMAAHLQP